MGPVREARVRLDEFHKKDEHSAGTTESLAVVHDRLAEVQLRRGELKSALDQATVSNNLCEQLLHEDPDSSRIARALATNNELLGDVLLARGEKKPALEKFEKSVGC